MITIFLNAFQLFNFPFRLFSPELHLKKMSLDQNFFKCPKVSIIFGSFGSYPDRGFEHFCYPVSRNFLVHCCPIERDPLSLTKSGIERDRNFYPIIFGLTVDFPEIRPDFETVNETHCTTKWWWNSNGIFFQNAETLANFCLAHKAGWNRLEAKNWACKVFIREKKI